MPSRDFERLKDIIYEDKRIASGKRLLKNFTQFNNKYMGKKVIGKDLHKSRLILLGTLVFLYGAIPFIISLVQGEISWESALISIIGVAINVLRLDTTEPIKKII